MGLGT